MPPPFSLEALLFVVGLLFGSFLNVCIVRLPHHRSIVTPRSHCVACKRTLPWYDNVPLLSFALLRGRCRGCGERFSWQYPVVELLTGLLFAWCFRLAYMQATQIYDFALDLNSITTRAVLAGITLAVLGFLLLGLAVMDLQTHRLPDAFTLTGIALGFFLLCTEAILLPAGAGDIHLNTTHQLRMSSPGSMASQGNLFLTGPESLVFGRVLAICCAALLLWAVGRLYQALRGRRGLGAGDVKLLAMIAAFLGFWPAMLALFLALVLILPWALYLLATGRARGTTALPFGAFLALGGFLSAVAGQPMLHWYHGLL